MPTCPLTLLLIAAPSTTIVPFNNPAILPACAASCKALYDANANCVPPVIKTNDPSAWNQCLCLRPELVPFVTSAAQPCATACTDAAGATSLANWFKSLCSPIAPQIFQTGGNLGTVPGQTTVTGKDGKPTASAIPTATVRPNFGNNGDWYVFKLTSHEHSSLLTVLLLQDLDSLAVGSHAGCPDCWYCWYLDRRLHLAPPLPPQEGSPVYAWTEALWLEHAPLLGPSPRRWTRYDRLLQVHAGAQPCRCRRRSWRAALEALDRIQAHLIETKRNKPTKKKTRRPLTYLAVHFPRVLRHYCSFFTLRFDTLHHGGHSHMS